MRNTACISVRRPVSSADKPENMRPGLAHSHSEAAAERTGKRRRFDCSSTPHRPGDERCDEIARSDENRARAPQRRSGAEAHVASRERGRTGPPAPPGTGLHSFPGPARAPSDNMSTSNCADIIAIIVIMADDNMSMTYYTYIIVTMINKSKTNYTYIIITAIISL